MRFLLDTSFLMAAARQKVDVPAELQNLGHPELFTINLVIIELKKLQQQPGATGREARLALQLLDALPKECLRAKEKTADAELVRLSRKGFIVCSQDRELIENIKKKGKAVTIRQGKYAVIV